MAEKPEIDYVNASAMLDVVQKVATVAPRYTNLSQLAMAELKEMDEEAKGYHNEVAKELAAEHAKAQATEQARLADEAEESKPKPRAIPAKDIDSAPVERRV